MNKLNKKKYLKENNNLYYTYPCCQVNNCNSFIYFRINPYNFTIDYQCDKNPIHNGKDISYNEFMKFFKKMKFNTCQCFNCQSNILNDEIYNCNICKRVYCSECFMIDNHLKEYIPNKNLYYNEKKPNIKKIKFNIRMLENKYRIIIKSICEWEEELKYKLNSKI